MNPTLMATTYTDLAWSNLNEPNIGFCFSMNDSMCAALTGLIEYSFERGYFDVMTMLLEMTIFNTIPLSA